MKRGYETADVFEYELLEKFAKDNRRYSTEAESILWNMISAKQLGVKFRRQHIIGGFIVDFVCLKSRLIIEVDGKYHLTDVQRMKDEDRTAFLESYGYHVIRFPNDQIIGDPQGVLEEIKRHLTTKE